MSYKKKTKHYSIPYLSDGEPMDGNEQERIAKIVDNLLFAGNLGVAKALFDDGSYSIIKTVDKRHSLVIQNSASYSLIGIVNYRLFCTGKVVEFKDLYQGAFYYIYIAYCSALDIDEEAFARIATTDKYSKDDTTKILLATVDFRGETPIIEENPDGKMYSEEILAHTADTTNPHGRKLVQDEINVIETLKIKDIEIYRSIYVTGNFAGKGLEWNKVFENDVVFVNIMPIEIGYGEYQIKIEGNTVRIVNTGLPVMFKAEIKVK